MTTASFVSISGFRDNSGKLIQLTKEELTKRINGAAVCCVIMETMLRAGLKLWLIPPSLARQAKEAQKRAQDKKDGSRDRDKRIVCCIIDIILCGFGMGNRGDGVLRFFKYVFAVRLPFFNCYSCTLTHFITDTKNNTSFELSRLHKRIRTI